jgi:hypothetical protein
MRMALARTILFGAFAALTAFPVRAQTHVLVVTGLGGEPKFSERFQRLGGELTSALRSRFGVADANIAWLGEDSARKPADPRYRGQSTRVAVEREVAAIKARAKAGEQVALVFIGHGSGAQEESRISLPGPDITVLDVKRLVESFTEQRVAVVNLTSGSGDMLPILAAPGRVVITATKTSFERNESRFAEQFVAAFARDVADTDKDRRVSLLEAFTFAARETKRIYDDATKMQTEHAQLDDNGTKQGTAEPTGRTGQGTLARRFFFDARALAAGTDARMAALYLEKFDLEGTVDSLRALKPKMDAAAYETDLERVLVALARKAREIRQAEGRP